MNEKWKQASESVKERNKAKEKSDSVFVTVCRLQQCAVYNVWCVILVDSSQRAVTSSCIYFNIFAYNCVYTIHGQRLKVQYKLTLLVDAFSIHAYTGQQIQALTHTHTHHHRNYCSLFACYLHKHIQMNRVLERLDPKVVVFLLLLLISSFFLPTRHFTHVFLQFECVFKYV